MSDSNRVQLSYIKETNWGVTPAASALQIIRLVSESFAQQNQTVQSDEIRSDRQIGDIVRTGVSAGGDLGIEFSYGTYDDILQAVFCSADWTAAVVVDAAVTTISAAATDNSFSNTAAWAANPAVGDWIKVSGFATAANNGYFKVVSATANKIVVSGGVLADEVAGEAISITAGSKIVNGTTAASFTFERKYTDLANDFAIYKGFAPNTFSLQIQSAAKITGSFGFMGKTEASAAATVGNAYTAATTTKVMEATDNVLAVLENQASYPITQFNMQVSNNIRQRLQVATLGAESLGLGEVGITGTLQAYYKNKAAMDKYLNNTESSIAQVLVDSAGNAYVLDLPCVKFSNGRRVAGGKNQDIIADMQWMAKMHATEGITARLVRFPVA